MSIDANIEKRQFGVSFKPDMTDKSRAAAKIIKGLADKKQTIEIYSKDKESPRKLSNLNMINRGNAQDAKKEIKASPKIGEEKNKTTAPKLSLEKAASNFLPPVESFSNSSKNIKSNQRISTEMAKKDNSLIVKSTEASHNSLSQAIRSNEKTEKGKAKFMKLMGASNLSSIASISSFKKKKYKPYSLRDYKLLLKYSPPQKHIIGPNQGSSEWFSIRDKIERIRVFNEETKQINSGLPMKSKWLEELDLSKQKRMSRLNSPRSKQEQYCKLVRYKQGVY